MAEVFQGIDGVLRAQQLDENSADRAISEALDIAYKVKDAAIDGNSPLVAFARKKRQALVDALLVLPDIRLSDTDSLTRLQRSIEEYRDLIAFLNEAVQPLAQADDMDELDESMSAVDFADLPAEDLP